MNNLVYLLLLTPLLGIVAQASDSTLIDFELEDQFRNTCRDEDWRGDVVLLIGSDQDGSKFDAVWEKAIRNSLSGRVDLGKLRLVHVADVRGVPFFLKGAVRRNFPKDDASPILLDWKGRFATAYGFEKDKANILVFDQQARLKHQVAVEGMNAQRLDEAVNLVLGLLDQTDSAHTSR